jgi:hypothetical protein
MFPYLACQSAGIWGYAHSSCLCEHHRCSPLICMRASHHHLFLSSLSLVFINVSFLVMLTGRHTAGQTLFVAPLIRCSLPFAACLYWDVCCFCFSSADFISSFPASHLTQSMASLQQLDAGTDISQAAPVRLLQEPLSWLDEGGQESALILLDFLAAPCWIIVFP